MSDKEMLDLIAYYAWPIVWVGNARCVIVTKGGSTEPQEDIRKAVRDALNLQVHGATSAV
jgi:hypothetical protein